MNNVVITGSQNIPCMSEGSIQNVRMIEEEILKYPQTNIETSHTFHAGVYARTIFIPEGVILTGALIKIPTLIIVSGSAIVYIGDGAVEMVGYNVVPSSANRKQVFIAKSDTYLTMVFATEAKTIEDAEQEFTDECDVLMSRKPDAVNYFVEECK